MNTPVDRFLRELRIGSYRNDIRVLCHNCNMSLGFSGYCPHSRETKIRAD